MKQQESELDLDFDVFHQVQDRSLPLTDDAGLFVFDTQQNN